MISEPSPLTHILVRGAREHNLRDFDVDIPRDRFVVITGPSGSGKSTLAFDTIYAEGQRRYVESLSAYARQFLEQMAKPDVDSIDGLSPAVAIEQRTIGSNPRSTVGTTTEIYDYLRLLYARVGRPHCYRCDRPIASQTLSQMTDRVLALGETAKFQVLAPVVRGRKGEYKKELRRFAEQGFVRVRIDGETRELGGASIALDRHVQHDIEVVVDRLVASPRARGRISESIETALRLSDGLVILDVGPGQSETLLSVHNACVACGISYPEIAPRTFSFNSPHGACPACSGLGTVAAFDPALIVPDASRSIADGAIAPWSGRGAPRYYRKLAAALAEHFEIDLDTPWLDLPERARDAIVHGSRDEIAFAIGPGAKSKLKRRWDGVMGELGRRLALADEREREKLGRFQTPTACTECGGSRLRVEARSIRLGGASLSEFVALPLDDAARFLEALELSHTERAIADRILIEIRDRLGFLSEVGLGYLTLDRPSASLSGGESQRIRLATQVGAHLMGVLYILDEPSIGLHPRDNARLIESLLRLRDQGNSVVVVEHDEATIAAADHLIDMGPGAGRHGGRVVAQGSPAQVCANPDSLTGAYLSGRRTIALPKQRRAPTDRVLVFEDCAEHNLKSVTLRLPLGLFVAVTGVSGSGKSTLITDTVFRALAARIHGAQTPPGRFSRIRGLDEIDKVIDVDQAPIGRTPRSNAATYTGALDGIRGLFSQVPEARMRGYAPGRFSFNVKGGRCESCSGDGVLRVEMHFMPDLFVRCEVCNGRRYNRETLEILYKGASVADVLEMTVEQALVFAENVPSVRRPLQTLADVGLGYLHVGQPATTLSGGEAQRVKLARELSRKDTGRTLYLLDEPTTGLHLADVEQLLQVIDQLVSKGNSVVVIEHHLDVVRAADWVIDLGPEGGAAGGEIVVAGTPEQVAAHATSHTGRALAQRRAAP